MHPNRRGLSLLYGHRWKAILIHSTLMIPDTFHQNGAFQHLSVFITSTSGYSGGEEKDVLELRLTPHLLQQELSSVTTHKLDRSQA